jgi:hypothetical protein
VLHQQLSSLNPSLSRPYPHIVIGAVLLSLPRLMLTSNQRRVLVGLFSAQHERVPFDPCATFGSEGQSTVTNIRGRLAEVQRHRGVHKSWFSTATCQVAHQQAATISDARLAAPELQHCSAAQGTSSSPQAPYTPSVASGLPPQHQRFRPVLLFSSGVAGTSTFVQ